MFVTQNTLAAINHYFQKKLEGKFSTSEIRFMFREFASFRLNKSPSELLLGDDILLSESDLLYFRNCANRLLKEEPFQYIIGHTYFHSVKLRCSPAALIPRPETEELVSWIYDTISPISTILDVCTGSGCIALALKKLNQSYTIVAVDNSSDAIALAKENSTLTNLQVDFLELDVLQENWFDSIQYEKFDVWVSNPPYIPIEEKDQMEVNVLGFEPHNALFVTNEDPIEFYTKIASDGWLNLNPKGYLFFEIHELRANAVIDCLTGLGYINIELRKDLQGKDRMIKAQKP